MAFVMTRNRTMNPFLFTYAASCRAVLLVTTMDHYKLSFTAIKCRLTLRRILTSIDISRVKVDWSGKGSCDGDSDILRNGTTTKIHNT
jgi:hypothetical protein